MELSLRKFGNSRGIIIPKTILCQLGMKECGLFEVHISSQRLILEPVKKIRDGWDEAAQTLASHPEYKLLFPELIANDPILYLSK